MRLGGAMALATDEAGIQFRTLNSSKGPGGTRHARAGRPSALQQAIRRRLENQPNLTLVPAGSGRHPARGRPGRRCRDRSSGFDFAARAVVLTAGTFLSGLVHVGLQSYQAGRAGDPASITLAARLREMKLPVGRLKTGTPPRLDGRTIDFSVMTEQPGDSPEPVFSFLGRRDMHPRQLPCWITHTNERTHEIIRGGLDRSPMFTGVIQGVGPRYCPSIEDKIHRFAGKTGHQIFLEPEGLTTNEIYPNGISTSLPFDVQLELVRSIRGLEQRALHAPGLCHRVRLLRPAQSEVVAGDQDRSRGCFSPARSTAPPATKRRPHRACSRARMPALQAQGKPAWCPRRDEAYLGVLVDDLITRGVSEPYRMFTSRAEYRLMLREDNADLRLTESGRKLGLVDDARWDAFSRKRDADRRARPSG